MLLIPIPITNPNATYAKALILKAKLKDGTRGDLALANIIQVISMIIDDLYASQ
jgi:hypothetical protein